MADSATDLSGNIRKKLEASRIKLTGRIGELLKQDPFRDPERVNDNAAVDQDASEEASHDRFSALITELRQEVERIDTTLSRIDNGTYGVCTGCGKQIEPERLAVIPTASLCLSCGRIRG